MGFSWIYLKSGEHNVFAAVTAENVLNEWKGEKTGPSFVAQRQKLAIVEMMREIKIKPTQAIAMTLLI